MNDFFNYLFGENSISFHIAGLIFALFGSLITKYHFWQKHKSEDDVFDIKYWLKDNSVSISVSLIVAFISVRFIDILIHLVNPAIKSNIGFEIPQTEDEIFYYLIAGILVQFWAHKKYTKKSE